MDDEVAQQTADLLFDLLPYYGTGNAEADQIFLATLQANDILAHSRDAHGNTLLMIACQASKQDIINLMIEKDVDVNAQNYMGVTALHIGKTFFYLFCSFPHRSHGTKTRHKIFVHRRWWMRVVVPPIQH